MGNRVAVGEGEQSGIVTWDQSEPPTSGGSCSGGTGAPIVNGG